MKRHTEVFRHETIRYTSEHLDEAACMVNIHDTEGYEYPAISSRYISDQAVVDRIMRDYSQMARLRLRGTANQLADTLDNIFDTEACFRDNKKAMAKIRNYVWRKIFN